MNPPESVSGWVAIALSLAGVATFGVALGAVVALLASALKNDCDAHCYPHGVSWSTDIACGCDTGSE